MRFHNLCRTCLRSGEQLLLLPDSIVPKLETPYESVFEMWKTITKVVMSESESTNQICKTCLDEIHRCYLFIVKCEQSGVILKGMRDATTANTKIDKIAITPVTTTSEIKFEEKCMNFISIPQLNSQQITTFETLNKVWQVPPTIETQVIVPQPVPQHQTVPCKQEVVFEAKPGTSLPSISTIPQDPGGCGGGGGGGSAVVVTSTATKILPLKSNAAAAATTTTAPQPKKAKRKPKEYTCEICFQTFKTKQTLKNHVTRDHEESGADGHLRCPVCPLVFVVASDLRAHLRTHPKDSPYTCEFCPRKFRYKTSLAYHATVKHGVAFQKSGD